MISRERDDTLTSQLGHVALHPLILLCAALNGVQAFFQLLQRLLGLLQTLLQLSPRLNLRLEGGGGRRKETIQ